MQDWIGMLQTATVKVCVSVHLHVSYIIKTQKKHQKNKTHIQKKTTTKYGYKNRCYWNLPCINNKQ